MEDHRNRAPRPSNRQAGTIANRTTFSRRTVIASIEAHNATACHVNQFRFSLPSAIPIAPSATAMTVDDAASETADPPYNARAGVAAKSAPAKAPFQADR